MRCVVGAFGAFGTWVRCGRFSTYKVTCAMGKQRMSTGSGVDVLLVIIKTCFCYWGVSVVWQPVR